MTDGVGAGGRGVAALVAVFLGTFAMLSGWFDLFTGASETLAGTILAIGRVLLGTVLLPTAWGLVRGRLWSRYLGIVAFGGIAIVQFLPMVAGATAVAPLGGVVLAGICALYLIFAGSAFGSGDDGRISEDTNPHFFMR